MSFQEMMKHIHELQEQHIGGKVGLNFQEMMERIQELEDELATLLAMLPEQERKRAEQILDELETLNYEANEEART